MFGLGPTELLVILVLALLFLGPSRMPEVAASLGKAIRSFRKATKDLRDQIEIEDEVRRPFEDLRAALRDEPPPPPRPQTLMSPPAQAPVPPPVIAPAEGATVAHVPQAHPPEPAVPAPAPGHAEGTVAEGPAK